MGPHKAGEIFKEKTPEAASYRVTLYGSLAATGAGHLTDKAIIDALAPQPVEVIWRADIVPEYHPNGMFFEALDAQGKVFKDWRVYSIGGGSLSEGPGSEVKNAQVYPHGTMAEIQKYIDERGMHFWEYVVQYEGEDIRDYLRKIWEHMQCSIEEGLTNDTVLPGQLHLRSKAKQYFIRASSLKASLQTRALVTSYALAVSEQNARGGKVVTAPACGS